MLLRRQVEAPPLAKATVLLRGRARHEWCYSPRNFPATVTAVGSGQTSMTIYGSQAADQVVMVDGMRLNLLEGSGQFSGIYL